MKDRKEPCTTYSDFVIDNMYRMEGMPIGKFIIYCGMYHREYNLIKPGYFYGLVQDGEGFILKELPLENRWYDMGSFEENMLNMVEKNKNKRG